MGMGDLGWSLWWWFFRLLKWMVLRTLGFWKFSMAFLCLRGVCLSGFKGEWRRDACTMEWMHAYIIFGLYQLGSCTLRCSLK